MEPIQLTLDITTDDLTRAVEAFCAKYMYTGENSSEAKIAFFKQTCIDLVIGVVNSYEMEQASKVATTAHQENTDEIVIT